MVLRTGLPPVDVCSEQERLPHLSVKMMVDLQSMRYTDHHPYAADGASPPKSLDLHIHAPTTSYVEVLDARSTSYVAATEMPDLTCPDPWLLYGVVQKEPGYGAGLGVLLVSLLTGLPVPMKASI